MSPTAFFWLSLALQDGDRGDLRRRALASMVAERSGPLIGALVATLPVSAGPVYVFLALDHDAAFIAQSALASLTDQRRQPAFMR